ncbi:MAG: hypothetical protein ABSE63_04410 [Thermoguttaceae bacterium]
MAAYGAAKRRAKIAQGGAQRSPGCRVSIMSLALKGCATTAAKRRTTIAQGGA